MEGQSEAKPLNEIYGNVKILNFQNISKDDRLRYLTKCLVCNQESIRRFDHLKLNPKYCKLCKDHFIGQKRIKVETVYNALFRSAVSNAKTRNLDFNITKEEFINLISQNCYYCNAEPFESGTSKLYNKTNTTVKNNGIDRLNSNLGYISDNVVPCCGTCNRMKNKFSTEIFFEKISKIYNKHLKECSTTISKGSTLQANGNGNGEDPNSN